MKKISYLLLMLLLPAFIMTGCSNDDDNGDKQIELPNQSEKTQTAFANDETTGGFTFTSKSTWTATITENFTANRSAMLTTKASTVSWLRLLLNGEETYNGSAGTFTLTIELDPNYSGVERSASVTIKSGNDEIVITVTQDVKTNTGNVLKQVSKIECVNGNNEKYILTFKYDTKGRIAEYFIKPQDNQYDPDGYEYYFSYNIAGEVRINVDGELWTLFINNEGNAKKIEKKSEYETKTYTLSYKNGYFSGEEYQQYEDEMRTITYEWDSNGNFSRTIDNYNGDIIKSYEHHNNILNNIANIDLNIFNQPFGGTDYSCNGDYYSYFGSDMYSREALDVAAMFGFLGKRSTYFVSALVYDEAHISPGKGAQSVQASSSQVVENLSFDLDDDGYPVKITSSTGRSYSISY